MKRTDGEATIAILILIAGLAICAGIGLVRGVNKAADTALQPLFTNLYTGVNASMRAHTAAVAFHQIKGRWPNDKDELGDFATSRKLDFNPAQFTALSFQPQTGPSTTVIFCFAPPLSGSSTGWILDVKSEEQK